MASLYLHIPFCEHKCIYCDFYSIAPDSSKDHYGSLIDRYLINLKREIFLRGDDPSYREPVTTIFFGGGTPSLLSPVQIADILEHLSKRFRIDPNSEITLETNPGTVHVQKLRDFRSVGINRLSIGIQSFHNDDLKFLTRIHTSEDAQRCTADARTAGFDNISIDLIFSLPNQTVARWEQNIAQVVALQPEHVSCYSLIVEPNTPLFSMVRNKQVSLVNADLDAELYQRTIEHLGKNGYVQYEVSNFSRPGYQCRHNMNYWNHTYYLGFGPSAHSFWNSSRWWNISNINSYCELLEKNILPSAGGEHLTQEQLKEETIFLGLRSNGIDLEKYRRQFDSDILIEYKSVIDTLIKDNIAVITASNLQLTAKGYALCDEICQMFR